jgi:hypothetical protein
MPLAILAPRPISVRLWQVAGLLVVWTLTLVVANFAAAPQDRVGASDFGHDFFAFYTAGTFANDGRSAQLYDLAAMHAEQMRIAREAGMPPFDRVAPWWNPPQVAWLFAPLARLPLHPALLLWTAFNLACLVASSLILMRVLRGTKWSQSLLVPTLIACSFPTLQFLGHGQNTGLSLLLLSGCAWAFVARRPLIAGAVAGLLAYKPQHAALLSGALVLLMGWRVLPGLLLTTTPQAAIAFATMPEASLAFVRQLPLNLRDMQFERPYPWDRHVTLLGFWRVLLQGKSTGMHDAATSVCATLSTIALFAGLALSWLRMRAGAISRDRMLAIAMLATPVLMPFYFDYDLLLLAVPATLVARECLARGDVTRADRAFAYTGVAMLVWTMLNIHVIGLTHVNGAVLLTLTLVAHASRRSLIATAKVDADHDGMLGYEDLQTLAPRRAA